MNKKYKVMIVDDSAFMRKLIRDVILTAPDFEIVAICRNGREALEQMVKEPPDIITLDLQMPEMDGLQTLSHLMSSHPVPVIMLSSFTQSGATETIRALELGAIDFVAKPAMKISYSLQELSDELIQKMRAAVTIKSINKPMRRMNEPKALVIPKSTKQHKSFTEIVAMGTSTGGPNALQEVVTQLPNTFAAPILIVQHMPANFTKSLADRLNTLCEVTVKEAEDGEMLQSGVAYVAPGGKHMTVKRIGEFYKIVIDNEAPVSGHRPSVNKLFSSLLSCHQLKKHIVIMTGMGNDGAEAMLALRKAGAQTTIAESEQTCVVYGMPKAALQMKAAEFSLPLHEIAKKLIEVVKQHND